MNGFGSGPSDGIGPVQVDPNVRFSSIGGLKEHIKCLREMIIFPLMYPELFRKFNTRPAKGVLFHGPPGTGKTLLARALANECSLVGGRKVAFFMRKGADVMNKYYGESERNLRTLFEQARKLKPSIIFFDEIDALAPARRPNNDNTHSSVVATLLAEMDGLCDRGDVVVIGATNRPDAMDPAVRRAGRFDRELYFPPPEVDARRDILAIYTRHWQPSLSDETLDQVAKLTVGYLGSDIKSLCSEAVLKAVKRVYPQIYESDYKLQINAKNVEVKQEDLLAAMDEMVPAGSRYMPQAARPLPPYTVPLLQGQLQAAAEKLRNAFPPPFSKQNQPHVHRNESSNAPSVFLVSGECAETHLAPALLAQMENCAVMELSMSTLHSAHVFTPEQAIISLFAECRRAGRACVIFIRGLHCIWDALERKQSASILLQLWRMHSVGDNTLMLATCNGSYEQLPSELKEVFPIYKDCIYRVRKPTTKEVTEFLAPVITELPLVPPIIYENKPPPPLPRATIGPRENEQDMVRRLFHEFDNLRRLRTSLRIICRGFYNDRRYSKFTSSVNPDIVADYCYIIRQPMDLMKVMQKIDDRKYYCAKEFLDDIDLICTNEIALCRLKPSRKGQCLQEAFALHAEAHKMTAEAIDPQLELECQLIARKRREQGDKDDGFDAGGVNDIMYYSKLCSDVEPCFKLVPKKSVITLLNDDILEMKARQGREVREGRGRTKSKRALNEARSCRRCKTLAAKSSRRGMSIRDTAEEKNNYLLEIKKSSITQLLEILPSCGFDSLQGDLPMADADDGLPVEDPENPGIGNKRTMPCEPREAKRAKQNKSEKQPSGLPPVKEEEKESEQKETNEEEKTELPVSNAVVISSGDLENILSDCTDPLSQIGLEALIDLHAQLSKTVQSYSSMYDRSQLPKDLSVIVNRYMALTKR